MGDLGCYGNDRYIARFFPAQSDGELDSHEVREKVVCS